MIFVHFSTTNAQQIQNSDIVVFNKNTNSLEIDFYLDNIDSKPLNDTFSIFHTPSTNSYTHDIGKPLLPVYQQIVQIPNSGDFTITVSKKNTKIVAQAQLGSNTPLAPTAPPTLKNIDTVIYKADSTTYHTDCFYGLDCISLKPIGQIRETRLARLTISPVRYNPVRQLVEICTDINATITFSNTMAETHNPLLHNLLPSTTPETKSYSNILAQTDDAQTYLIVAPPTFSHTLQPFVSWKRQEGFIVDEYYPQNATREGIKAHLQQLYDNATPNHPAPLFILLVGDVQQIPVWPGRQHIPGLDVHRTDLYYADFTGDALPDALLGRLSATDTATLSDIIAKTIDYEQFNFSDSSYLQRSLLVAGKENTPPAPTATNGQINYLKNCIMQHDNLHDTICYYNPDSDTMSAQIQNHLRQGVGFINYTAHCSSSGWMYPLLSNSIIDTLTLGNRLFVSINNCCRANDISGDCFGEHLLRKNQGGAVGVIGASNETLWNEDFYWSVGGNGDPTLTPQYSPSMPGAYDRLFHTNGQHAVQHAITQSQIVLAGNWAVTTSGSPYSDFYWEIYSLLGDPSLMPYIGIPATQQLDIDSITTGDVTIVLHGTPGARIAATKNDTLWGLCTIGDDSIGLITTILPTPDSLLFTATAQFYKPIQKKIVATPPTAPRLTATITNLQSIDNVEIEQLTLKDSAIASVTVRNVGRTTALNHSIQIHTVFPDTILLANTNIASLLPDQDTAIQFLIYPQTAGNKIILLFETGDSTTLWSQQRTIDLLVPNIEVAQLKLTDNDGDVTSLRPSTNYTAHLTLVNNGNGTAKDLKASLVGSETIAIGVLEANDTALCNFTLTTPDNIDSLTLTFLISHRADTTTFSCSFAADSNAEMQQPCIDLPNIEIWPNPANNNVTIRSLNTPTTITIYDTYGRIVDKLDTKNNTSIQYSTTHLRCGIYSIVFTTKNSPQPPIAKRLVIAR